MSVQISQGWKGKPTLRLPLLGLAILPLHNATTCEFSQQGKQFMTAFSFENVVVSHFLKPLKYNLVPFENVSEHFESLLTNFHELS